MTEDDLTPAQTHCLTCGKLLGNVRWRCPTCAELCCSEECREKHIKTMDNV
jgi:hypothetical protein